MAKEVQREKTIQTRVTDEEYKAIEDKADFLGLSISNYLRLIALHARIDISVNPTQDKKKAD